MKALFFALAILAGLSNPVQSAANTTLAKTLGPALAAAAIYGVALCGLVVLLPVLGIGARPTGARLAQIPWWGWVGGLCNLTFVIAASLATRQIGSAAFTVTTLTCAVCLSVLLDHFGLMGLEQHPASALRICGAVLAVAGVALVSLF